MKRRLLVCTIMRNQRPNVERWSWQLNELHQHLMGEWDIEYSVVENDSIDGTAEWLRLHVSAAFLSTDTLGTTQYGSVWSVDRLRNLAHARQRCLDQAGDLSRFDKVAFIEPDVTYDPRWCRELVLARHPLAAGLGEPDIYSGWSLRTEANPKESVFLYDVCATRATKDDLCWDVGETNGAWRGKTVIPTDLGGPDAMCLHPVWSTFNCFCVYNAAPFKRGFQWGYLNQRLDTGQGRFTPPNPFAAPGEEWHSNRDESGWLDADTAVVCEQFRAAGHDKVYLNTNCLVRHV